MLLLSSLTAFASRGSKKKRKEKKKPKHQPIIKRSLAAKVHLSSTL